MACKVLFYDYKDSEKNFFDNYPRDNFEIKIFSNSLNKKTVKELTDKELEETSALNICTPSLLSEEVINKFKNLRVIATRSQNVKNIDLQTCIKRNIAVVNTGIPANEPDSKIVMMSFKAITSVFCGCKDYRII